MDDVPSKYVLPSVSIKYGPFPRSMMMGSSCSHSCIWVKGCHTYCRSQSLNEAAFFVLVMGVVVPWCRSCGRCQENPMLERVRRGLYEGLFTLTTQGAVTIMNRFY